MPPDVDKLLADVDKLLAKRDLKGLIRALDYKETSLVRVAAAKALGKLGDPRSVDPLVIAITDESGFVREAATGALVQIGASAVKPLIAALNDQNWPSWPRFTCGETLGRMGAYAVDPLIGNLKHGPTYGRMWAAAALGTIGDRRALDPLTEALKDQDSSVRTAAAQALGKIRKAR